MDIGKKIKAFLKDNGIKLSWVAEQIGISKTTVYCALTSNKTLSVELYAKICNLFNLSLDYFLQ